jgi:hypothetical protein
MQQRERFGRKQANVVRMRSTMLASVGHRDSGSSTREGLSRSGATLIECRMAGQPPPRPHRQPEVQALADALSTVSTNKKALADQSRREPHNSSREPDRASSKESHRLVRAVPFSGVTRIASTHSGCSGMSSYGKRRTSRVLGCTDSPPEEIGGGAPSRKPVRRILHACPPNQGKGRAQNTLERILVGHSFLCSSYPRRRDFQANSASDF